jgi:hypothetical protein
VTNTDARGNGGFALHDAIEVLERTPRVLAAMLGGLGERWTHANYGEATFSPFDVVGHLIHAERTDWIARARWILENGSSKAFEPFDRFAMYAETEGKRLEDLLATFAELRSANLAALAELRLSEERLDLRGLHPALGAVTLRQLLATWVVHDLNHIHQIAKSMAFQYRDEVGPWREYLPLLPKTGG